MKNIIYITTIICFVSFTSCKAQQIVNANTYNQGNNEGKYFKDLNNYLAPFVGVWEYQNGNQIFRVTLWKEEMEECENGIKPSYFRDEIKGHYEIIEINSAGNEIVLKTSNKNIKNSTIAYSPVISGGSINGIELGGSVLDNTVSDFSRFSAFGIEGGFNFNIISNTNSTQAIWSCEIRNSLQLSDYPTSFSFPNNITLTKQ